MTIETQEVFVWQTFTYYEHIHTCNLSSSSRYSSNGSPWF